MGAGLVKPGSSSAVASTSKAAAPTKPVAKPSDPYSNYSTAESLGYTDPDAERRRIEAERRMKEGVVGVWEVVEVHEPGAESGEGNEDGGQADGEGANASAALEELERKRASEVQPDDDDIRPWKLRKKTLGAGLGEIYDPGIIPIKVKAKKEEPAPEPTPDSQTLPGTSIASSSSQSASALPRWSAKGWNRPGTAQDADRTSDSQPAAESLPETSAETDVHSSSSVKVEPTADEPELAAVKIEDTVAAVKAEEAETSTTPPTGSLFRKRKAPGGSKGRR